MKQRRLKGRPVRYIVPDFGNASLSQDSDAWATGCYHHSFRFLFWGC